MSPRPAVDFVENHKQFDEKQGEGLQQSFSSRTSASRVSCFVTSTAHRTGDDGRETGLECWGAGGRVGWSASLSALQVMDLSKETTSGLTRGCRLSKTKNTPINYLIIKVDYLRGRVLVFVFYGAPCRPEIGRKP